MTAAAVHSCHDRDLYVHVEPQDADKHHGRNLDQVLISSEDLNFYGFASNYALHRTQVQPQRPTDNSAVKRLSGLPIEATTVTTFRPILEVEVDGARFTVPQSSNGKPEQDTRLPCRARRSPATHGTCSRVRTMIGARRTRIVDAPPTDGWLPEDSEVQVRPIPERSRALNQDGTLNSAQNAATKGSVIVLYGTGLA